MKRLILAFVFLTAGFALAEKPKEPLPDLKARAEAAKAAEQVKLFLEVAGRQLQTADELYTNGDPDQAQMALRDVADYGERAGATACSTRKRLKETEIRLRDIQRKLEALRRSVDFDHREPLSIAIQRLDKVRSNLLSAMFGKKS